MRASKTFFALTLLLACGDDGSSPDAAVDTGTPTDATVDSTVDGGPMGETLAVLVVDGSSDDAPLEGVTVEVTSSAGFVSGMTGADGRVSFDDVVIEGAMISASATGYTASTILDMNASHRSDFDVDGAYFMRIAPLLPERARVTISGTITNGQPEGEFWAVMPTGALESYFGMDPMYAVEVPPGEERIAAVLEFDLLPAMRGRRGARSTMLTTGRLVTLPASATDATVDIDLSMDALTVETATGSYPIPAAPHPFHDAGVSWLSVTDWETGWVLGESGYVAADVDDTRFDYEAHWIAPAEATQPVTRYNLSDGPVSLVVNVDGWPSDGSQPVSWPDAIDVITPAFGASLRTGESIEADGIDSAHALVLQVRDESGEAPFIVWQIATPAGGELSLPPAPMHADLSATVLGGSIVACEMENPGPDFRCRRAASSRAFDVEP